MANFYNLWYLQIIVEALPISSSGHLRLANKFFPAYMPVISKIQEEIMHLPSTFAFAAVLLHHFWPLIVDLPQSLNTILFLVFYILIADFMTAVFYYLFNKLNSKRFPLSLGFSITAALLLSLFFLFPGTKQNLTFTDAIILGITQGIALLPGISRMASTTVIGCWLGLLPTYALLISCSLQFPLLIAGVGKAVYQSKKLNLDIFPQINFNKAILLAICTLISYLFLEFNFFLIQENYFAYFGFYMLIPVLLSLFQK